MTPMALMTLEWVAALPGGGADRRFDKALKEKVERGEAVTSQRGSVTSRLEREFFIDNLMVRIHFSIVMILVDRPCAMGV